jgi:NTE family protein
MRKLLLIVLFLSSVCSAKVGLVLSGGGAKGFVHIGVLKTLDEHNIKVDYIAGTSMGCIIGALYAVGYSGKEIEKMVLEENWMNLFEDKPTRKYVSMCEKDDSERYIGSFSLSPNRSFLPSGVLSGQRIYMLFSRMTWDDQGIKDFKKLPIPVVCIAADVETGEAVVLDKGNLAESMRASMAIPTVFTPVEINDRLLVDGGIVNNLPVSEVKKMGADFVIAVDAFGPLYKKDDMDSFLKIIEQVVSLASHKRIGEEKKAANVLIEVDTGRHSLAAFDSAKGLIEIGEQAVRPYLASLDKLPKIQSTEKKKDPGYMVFNVRSVKIEGLKGVSEDLVLNSMDITFPDVVGQEDIEAAVEKIYGTQFFDTVTYDMRPLSEGEFELVIRVKERAASLFRFGFNYSGFTRGALLLNTTFKNIAGKDSKVSLDLNLSGNPAFRGQYYLYSSKRPGFRFRTELLYNRFDLDTYQNGLVQALYRFSYYALSFNVEKSFSNYMLFGMGMDKEFTSKDPTLHLPQFSKNYNEFLTLTFFLKLDTTDSGSYPKKGIKIDADLKVATDGLSFQNGISHRTFERASINSTFAVPFSKRISLLMNADLGASNGDNTPYEYLFYLGGFRANNRWFTPFVGLDYMSASGPNVFILGGAMQFEILHNIYLIFKTNVGKLANEFHDVFNMKDKLLGAGITLGWDSPIGPVEASLMREMMTRNFVASASVGYWF